MGEKVIIKINDALAFIHQHGYGIATLEEINRTERRYYLSLLSYSNARATDFSQCDAHTLASLIATGGVWQLIMHECGEENLKFPKVGFTEGFIDYLTERNNTEPLREYFQAVHSVHLSSFAAKAAKTSKRKDVAALDDYILSKTPTAISLARKIAPQLHVLDKERAFTELLEVMRPLLFSKKKEGRDWLIRKYDGILNSTCNMHENSTDKLMWLDSVGSIRAEAIWKEADKMLQTADITMLASPTWHFASWAKVASEGDLIDRLRNIRARKRTTPEEKEEKVFRDYFEKCALEHFEAEQVIDRSKESELIDIEEIPSPGDFTVEIEVNDILERLKLTKPQKQVLDLLGDGYSKADVAHQLGISKSAVSQHISAIRKKCEREMQE
jgi:RNA polymerase sigma factor (sigma-70 family)